jgi:hypothetical protein
MMNPSRRNPRLRIGSFIFCLFLTTAGGHAQVAIQIGQNFTSSTYYNGLNTGNSSALPPDPNGAIGPNHFVEFINGSFTVYNKTNGASVIQISDEQFWANAGVTLSIDAGVSDPRIIYDPTAQRWFASQVDLNATILDPTVDANNFLIAVSASSNPAGTWQGFHFIADPTNGDFADFPTLGVDSNAVYISGDMFHGQDNPLGCALVSIPKVDLLAGTPTINNRTPFGVMNYSVRGQVLQPVTCFDGSSSGNILATGNIGMNSTPYSNLVAFAVLNGATTNATLTAPTSISVSSYQVPYDAQQGIPLFTPIQPDGTTMLAGNDARFSARVYAVGGVMYAVHNTELNGRMAIHWYRISATNYTVLESGTIADSNLDLFYPSIAANNNGTVVIACNGSSINTNVSCYAVAGQTVNGVTSFGNLLLLQFGVTSYHGDDETILDPFEGLPPLSRWGDYSTLSVDPNDSTRFWCVQMFPSDPANNDVWSTQITELLTSLPLPQLSITRAGTDAMVSWPGSAAGYQLKSTTSLVSPVAWSNVTNTESTNGGTISVLVPVSGGQQFFRLQK